MTNRQGGRRADQLRALSITRHYARYAEGSALIECGDTRVLCTASVEEGVPPPCAAQLAYSLVRRSPVEDHDMVAALKAAKASVVASYSLDGGALTGKYTTPGAKGRMTDQLDARDYGPSLRAGDASVFGAPVERIAGYAHLGGGRRFQRGRQARHGRRRRG